MNALTYQVGDTAIHRCDARMKSALILAYSITLFVVHTWVGLAICAVAAAVVTACAHIRPGAALRQLMPLLLVFLVTIVFNSFSFQPGDTVQLYGAGIVSAGVLQNVPAVPLIGDFSFLPAGFARGCFYACRLLLLVSASVVLTSTTSTVQISDALEWFMRPLRALRVPTGDIAQIVSIALRFIPVTIDEFMRVQTAQMARGASFGSGPLRARLRAWETVLVPLFAGLFKRADRLAVAMEARAYGAAVRTRLNDDRVSTLSCVVSLAGILACISVGMLF